MPFLFGLSVSAKDLISLLEHSSDEGLILITQLFKKISGLVNRTDMQKRCLLFSYHANPLHAL